MHPKLFIGPISKEIVDCVIDYSLDFDVELGLIPSRRQVDTNSGYTGFTTRSLNSYVLGRTPKVLQVRDHGGPKQGDYFLDDGIESFKNDCTYMDVIHIDPFKAVDSLEEGVEQTINFIKLGLSLNETIKFEILTEATIFPMSFSDLENVLDTFYDKLNNKEWNAIKWVVLQSGTALLEDSNIGEYNEEKLKDSIEVIHEFELLSKEHNGDYLQPELIKRKFELGLDSINIAPEFGKIQSQIYWDAMNNVDKDIFFRTVLHCNRWAKWTKNGFVPLENKEKLIQIAGHYVFTHPDFIRIKPDGLEDKIKKQVYNKINSILNV